VGGRKTGYKGLLNAVEGFTLNTNPLTITKMLQHQDMNVSSPSNKMLEVDLSSTDAAVEETSEPNLVQVVSSLSNEMLEVDLSSLELPVNATTNLDQVVNSSSSKKLEEHQSSPDARKV